MDATPPDKFDDAAARDAAAAGRFDEALAAWAALRASHPKHPRAWLGSIEAARAAQRPVMACRLIVEGAQRCPGNAELARLLAAIPRGARERAEEFIARRAGPARPARAGGRSPGGGAGPAKTAPDAKREAAEILAIARKRRAGPVILVPALARAEALVSAYPRNPDARVAEITVLRALKRLDEARARAEAALLALPGSLAIALLLIDVLDDAGDLKAARDAAMTLRTARPNDAQVEARLIGLTSRLGEDAAAEAAVTAARQRFPNSAAVLTVWATLAQRRGEWQEALARWEHAAAQIPANARIRLGLGACRLQLTVAEVAGTSESDLAAFFSRFESLGGTLGGCEFGMVQRNHGSAALGLLRWSNIRPEQLITGLQKNFAGLGVIENTELHTLRLSPEREEYIVYDRNYSLGSHTFISTKDAPYDKMLVQTARRLAYLRDAMLDLLRKGERVFVYKFFDTPPDAEAVMTEIFEALRRHGANRLICAIRTPDAATRGTVRKLRDGLYVGYIGQFMGKDATGIEFDVEAWKSVCAAVLADAPTP